jgi:hypothetical protein
MQGSPDVDLQSISSAQPKISTFDWLSEGNSHKEVWLEHAKKIIDEERMKECTFKPQRVTTHSTVSLGPLSGTRQLKEK